MSNLVWLPFNSQGVLLDGRGLAVDGLLWVGDVNKDPQSYPVGLWVDGVAVVNPVAVVGGVVPVLMTDVGAVSLLLLDRWGRQVWYLNRVLVVDVPVVVVPPVVVPVMPPPVVIIDPISLPALPVVPPFVDKFVYGGIGLFYSNGYKPVPDKSSWLAFRRGELSFADNVVVGLSLQDLVGRVLGNSAILARAMEIFDENVAKFKVRQDSQFDVIGEFVSDDRVYSFGGLAITLNFGGGSLSNISFENVGGVERVVLSDIDWDNSLVVEREQYIIEQVNHVLAEKVDLVSGINWQVGQVFDGVAFVNPDSPSAVCLFGTSFFNPFGTYGEVCSISVEPFAKGSGSLVMRYDDGSGDKTFSRQLEDVRFYGDGGVSAFYQSIMFRYVDYVFEKDDKVSLWG